MEKDKLNEALWEIAGRFYTPKPFGLMGAITPPIDTRKPNQHDNKKDFLKELSAVQLQLDCGSQLFEELLRAATDDDPNHDLGKHIARYVNGHVRGKSSSIKLDSTYQLVRKNVADIGISRTLLWLLLDLTSALSARKQELEDQEAEFWSGSSRPPNHYARTIALRFARLIAQETGSKPTFGTSSDGGHPSTDFGRALEEIFELLKIRANVNRATIWALDQLQETDYVKPNFGLFGGPMPSVDVSPNSELLKAMLPRPKGFNL